MVLGNTQAGRPDGKCNRKQTAWLRVHRNRTQVRVKRWCKRPPASRVTGAARQTPPGARPSRERAARSSIPGRPHEPGQQCRAQIDGRCRSHGPAQNPAYNSTRNQGAPKIGGSFAYSASYDLLLTGAFASRPSHSRLHRHPRTLCPHRNAVETLRGTRLGRAARRTAARELCQP